LNSSTGVVPVEKYSASDIIWVVRDFNNFITSGSRLASSSSKESARVLFEVKSSFLPLKNDQLKLGGLVTQKRVLGEEEDNYKKEESRLWLQRILKVRIS